MCRACAVGSLPFGSADRLRRVLLGQSSADQQTATAQNRIDPDCFDGGSGNGAGLTRLIRHQGPFGPFEESFDVDN